MILPPLCLHFPRIKVEEQSSQGGLGKGPTEWLSGLQGSLFPTKPSFFLLSPTLLNIIIFLNYINTCALKSQTIRDAYKDH